MSERFLDSNISHPFTRETMTINGSVMASGNLELQHLSLSCMFIYYIIHQTFDEFQYVFVTENYMLCD